MLRTTIFASIAALGASSHALAVGRIANVTVIDRTPGTELPVYRHRGEYWIAGTPGGAYAIEIRNQLGARILAVTAVDGVNVISGETAAWDQTGYVFGPNQQYQVSGWRKSDSEVAAFTFTESPNSYAERTGRPANVGVIGIALYREQAPVAQYPLIPPPVPNDADNRAEANVPAAQLPESTSGAPALGDSATARTDSSAGRMAVPPVLLEMPAPKLGTGHGAREYSHVSYTDFERLQSQPNEIIRIRYDSLGNLMAMGIVPRQRPMAPGVNPFPGSPSRNYVPDPPG